jgi:hypothetical protein
MSSNLLEGRLAVGRNGETGCVPFINIKKVSKGGDMFNPGLMSREKGVMYFNLHSDGSLDSENFSKIS